MIALVKNALVVHNPWLNSLLHLLIKLKTLAKGVGCPLYTNLIPRFPTWEPGNEARSQHKCDLGIFSLLSCCPTGHSSVSSQDSSSDQSGKLRAAHTIWTCSSLIPRHSDWEWGCSWWCLLMSLKLNCSLFVSVATVLLGSMSFPWERRWKKTLVNKF